MSDGPERRMTIKNAFIRYYQTERDRSESCISDIIDALGDKDNTESQTIQNILDRIIMHYGRRS